MDLRRARWHRILAEGHYSLVQHDRAREHYEKAIRLCGFPNPRFGARSVVEVVKHVAWRYFPPGEVPAAELRERCIEALRAADNLQVVALWQGDQMTLAHVVFEAANIATVAGPSAESAFARAMVGYLEVMGGLHGVAVRDLNAAVAMAEEAGQLLQVCSTNMYLGMSLALLARFDEATSKLKRADETAKKLGAGLWKHRGPFMLAEPYLMTGRLPGPRASSTRRASGWPSTWSGRSPGSRPACRRSASCAPERSRRRSSGSRGRARDPASCATSPPGCSSSRASPPRSSTPSRPATRRRRSRSRPRGSRSPGRATTPTRSRSATWVTPRRRWCTSTLWERRLSRRVVRLRARSPWPSWRSGRDRRPTT